MFSPAGIIIYKAFAPTLKMMICIGLGYLITKKGAFPPQFAKGVGFISLNVSLPALIFSSVVSAFTPDNIAAFGPLAMVAILYMFIGLFMGWIVREVFYVPHDFYYGILVMSILSNWGNLPIAVTQTVAADAPFDPSRDVELGVAYISVFVLLMQTAFFPLGLHKLCALDFNEEHLAKPPKEPFKQRLRRWLSKRRKDGLDTDLVHEKRPAVTDEEASLPTAQILAAPLETSWTESSKEKRYSTTGSDHGEGGEEPGEMRSRYGGGLKPTRKTSRASSFTSQLERTRSIPATAPVDAIDTERRPDAGPSCTNDDHDHASAKPGFHKPITPVPSIHKTPWTKKIINFIRDLATPVSISIAIAIPCGIISPLKALFVPVANWTGDRVPNAPDGNPPLAFIIDTAAFIGAISIPAALILLGASFARLKMPKNWRDLPLAAIFAMTIVKMILIPVFGIFFVQALQGKESLFPTDDKIRTFVAILLSGTPAAVNQLVVTQLYNPDGSAHTLASFLMLQYIAMPVLSTALAAIALYVVDQ